MKRETKKNVSYKPIHMKQLSIDQNLEGLIDEYIRDMNESNLSFELVIRDQDLGIVKDIPLNKLDDFLNLSQSIDNYIEEINEMRLFQDCEYDSEDVANYLIEFLSFTERENNKVNNQTLETMIQRNKMNHKFLH